MNDLLQVTVSLTGKMMMAVCMLKGTSKEYRNSRIKEHINLSQTRNKWAYARSQHTPEAFDLYMKVKSAG